MLHEVRKQVRAATLKKTGVICSSFAEDEEDFQGLPPGPGREEVFYTCSACHSLSIVKQQRLSRKDWDETLSWMVEEQGMAELTKEELKTILNYLFRNFGFKGVPA